MKKFFEEFGEFIRRGNAMDMAVGVIIGGAFTAIVTSLTTNILDPVLKLVTGSADSKIPGMSIPVGDTGTYIDFSAFISAVINFILVAFIVFLIVKAMNGFDKKQQELRRKLKGEEAPVETNPPTCPFCKEEVKEGATRCPHCAAEFAEPAVSTPKEG